MDQIDLGIEIVDQPDLEIKIVDQSYSPAVIPEEGGSNSSPVSRVDQVDVEQYVPFDSSCYSNGICASLYMTPSSSPPRNRTHDRKHQKKKMDSHSCQTKPNKLKLILFLPDCKFNSVHHSLKYDRK